MQNWHRTGYSLINRHRPHVLFLAIKILKRLTFKSSILGLYRTSLSGPEVRQIFKVRTHQKPDVLLPGPQTFITWNNGEKIQKKIQTKVSNFFFHFFSIFFFIFVFHFFSISQNSIWRSHNRSVLMFAQEMASNAII